MPTDTRPFEPSPASTAAPELTIRRATAADTEAILELLRLCIGEYWNVALKLPWDERFWSWKHLANPFGASPCLLAEAEGRLVGLRVFMRWGWQLGAERVEAVRALDTATHPDWRGQRIFSRLTLGLVEEMRQEGVSFVFNTPNDVSRPGYLKMGWSSMGRLSLWIRPLRPIRMLRSLAAKGRGGGAGSGGPGAPAVAPTRIHALFAEPRLEEFLRGLRRPDARLRTPRSPEYLRWRYLEIPGAIYDAVWDLDGADGAVLLFRRKSRSGMTELRVCEILVGPTRRSRQMARALLRELVSDADADYASAMPGAGTDERRVVAGSGFLPAPRLGPIFTARPLNPLPGGADPLARSSWSTALGDLELF